MTFEGRKFTHELCLKQGKPSPYADEFKEEEKVAENGLKSKSKGVKK